MSACLPNDLWAQSVALMGRHAQVLCWVLALLGLTRSSFSSLDPMGLPALEWPSQSVACASIPALSTLKFFLLLRPEPGDGQGWLTVTSGVLA